MSRDPRPDLAGDHDFWEYLLHAAIITSPKLAGALDGIRCYGARLEKTPQGLRLIAGDIEPVQWGEWRAQWLLPHTVMLTQMLNGYKETLRPPEIDSLTPVPLDMVRGKAAGLNWPALMLDGVRQIDGGQEKWDLFFQLASNDDLVLADRALDTMARTTMLVV